MSEAMPIHRCWTYDVPYFKMSDFEILVEKDDIVRPIYNTLKTKIIPELEKLGIYNYIAPVYDFNWDDDPYDYVREIYGQLRNKNKPEWGYEYPKGFFDNFMIYVFRLDETCKGIDKTKRPIKIEYGYFNNETLNKIKVIFETHLPDNYYWPTEQGHDGNKYLMMIYYNPEKRQEVANRNKG